MRFHVLGPVCIANESHTITLGGARSNAFLVTLLLSKNRPVSFDRLAESLWDGEPPASAKANLRSYASKLRRILGPGDRDRLKARDGRYHLRVAAGEIDAATFGDLARRGSAALRRADLDLAVRLLREALGLWRGPAAQDVPRLPGLAPHLLGLEESRLGAAEELMEALLAQGQLATVVSEARAFLADNPCRERAWALLMLSLYRGGDVAGALGAFADARSTFVNRLGMEPGPELRELQTAILHRDSAAGRSRQEPLTMVDGSSSWTLTPPVVPHQLPRDVARLVGRETQLSDLRTRVLAHEAPVVAIHGPAGVGKSALALRLAHAVSAKFPDGHLYFDLRGNTIDQPPTDQRAVLDGALRALTGRPGQSGDSADESVARFRSLLAGRRMLLVIDNAVDVGQVRRLLPPQPHSACIVTSRRMLSTLDGAYHCDLQPLSTTMSVDLLGHVAGNERVVAEPDAAREVVRLCDHLPLALRIVGARLATRPSCSLEDFAARLRDSPCRLDELEFEDLSLRSRLLASLRALEDSHNPLDHLAVAAFALVGKALLSAERPARTTEDSGLLPHRALDRLVDLRLLDSSGSDLYRISSLVALFAAECGAGIGGKPGTASQHRAGGGEQRTRDQQGLVHAVQYLVAVPSEQQTQ
ncbi:AfsR/SARP family transcriptional regulator [Nonomuraea jiangxiensis]|uniref:DNA-binding transcriptional activator of the SARP family n=1 Tax=Nonomuraea jiangxiensis TaxID=633440 RepID=A0A1G7Z1J8_9ACTN|nr:BTAD domain-containing putative transcriptional regulator [Nonomuraea jiangxiensis]SDH02487.1 DNA-binding transcriptional activator of the SARP family [Nonomuraea jiangxiensis]